MVRTGFGRTDQRGVGVGWFEEPRGQEVARRMRAGEEHDIRIHAGEAYFLFCASVSYVL